MRFTTSVVSAIIAARPGLQRVDLDDGRRAYVLTQLVGPVAVGDRGVLNTTAVDLGLGTGGWDVVHWNMSREEWVDPGGGHVMKLRYTSLQVDVGVAEEHQSVVAEELGGRPVVVCDVHSQLAPVAVAFAAFAPGRRLSFVMTDSAALPLALSDLVAELQGRGFLEETITCGQAFGGDREAVNVPSALLLSRGDAIAVAPGPGAVGTGTALGFGSLEMSTVIDAAALLGGRPIVAVRYSGVDARVRHRGRSHHTATVLAMASREALAPEPEEGWVAPLMGFDVTTMGRGPDEDPEFFRYAAAAGRAAAQLLTV